MCEHIQLIKKSAIHWEIVLNRPEKYNAITNEMYVAMTQILQSAAQDEQLVLLSMTGKGKYYSSGTDLADPAKAFMSNDDIEQAMNEGKNRLKNFIESFISFPKILVGFINGPAMGISVTLLALFDGVYASSNATFALPFIRIAQAPEACSSFSFPLLMGSLHAKELLLFDKKIDAYEAQQKGLVTRVFDQSKFDEEKDKICQQILSLPKQSLLTSKVLIQKWNLDTLKYVNEYELNNLQQRWTSEEFAQAMITFLNKKTKSNL